MKGAAKRDGTARVAAWFCRDEMTLEGREMMEGLIGAAYLLAGDEGDADLSGRDRGNVSLAVVAPVDFDEVTPGFYGVVLAQTDTAGPDDARGETGQGGDAGPVAVGTDEVTSADGLRVGLDGGDLVVGSDVADGVLPVEANPEATCAIEQKRMQRGAADSAAGVCGKNGLGGDGVAGGS